MTLWTDTMAIKDTTSIHQRGRAVVLAALVTAALALGGATAAATAAGPAVPDRLRHNIETDRTDTAQLAISDEDDCSMASFRCTRGG
jgi:hypothetical protein